MRHKTTILFQMITGFSIILILVISAISYFSYRYSSKVLLDKTTQYLLESVIQMSGKIDGMLGEYDRLSLRIAFHPATQYYLINSNRRPSSYRLSVYDIQKVITHEQAYIGNDLLVEIMDMRGEMAFYEPPRPDFKLEQMPWHSLLKDRRGGILWTTNGIFYRTEGENKKNMINGILGVREINKYDAESVEAIGNMLIVIPVEATERVIGNFLTTPSNKIQVIDQTGHIVYSTDSSEFGTTVASSFFSEVRESKSNGKIVQRIVNDKPMYISSYTSSYSNWTVVTYIDISKAVQDLRTMQKSIIIIGTLGIIASLLLISFFSWSLSLPLRNLTYRLSGIKRGKLMPHHGRLNYREVAVLYDSFNQMIQDLEVTIKDLSYKQIRENQAHLIALKAQFSPHFLYNSLNIIYFYAVKDKQNNVANMVLALSEMLRYSILPGSEFVELKDDLDQLNRFIQLQRYRYEDKLNIEIEVEEELLQYPVMKLLLQPLVENAITHGLEEVKGRPWLIRIHISEKDEFMNFTIEDSGKGMSAEEMEQALKYQDNLEVKTMHSGLGVPNLQHRIKLIYGEEYGLILSKSDLGGLKVELKLPVQNRQPNGESHHEHSAR